MKETVDHPTPAVGDGKQSDGGNYKVAGIVTSDRAVVVVVEAI